VGKLIRGDDNEVVAARVSDEIVDRADLIHHSPSSMAVKRSTSSPATKPYTSLNASKFRMRMSIRLQLSWRMTRRSCSSINRPRVSRNADRQALLFGAGDRPLHAQLKLLDIEGLVT